MKRKIEFTPEGLHSELKKICHSKNINFERKSHVLVEFLISDVIKKYLANPYPSEEMIPTKIPPGISWSQLSPKNKLNALSLRFGIEGNKHFASKYSLILQRFYPNLVITCLSEKRA